MKWTKTPIRDCYLIDLDKKGDERGFFARVFCREEFSEKGLEPTIAQVNNSFSRDRGTLRGLHYQLPPKEEDKVVRCLQGSLWDVVVDLRPDSPSFKQWFGTELSASNRTMMHVPKGCAHGFITLEEETEILYLVSELYSPDLERGIRWDDPFFGIEWPIEPTVISERDRRHPYFNLERV